MKNLLALAAATAIPSTLPTIPILPTPLPTHSASPTVRPLPTLLHTAAPHAAPTPAHSASAPTHAAHRPSVQAPHRTLPTPILLLTPLPTLQPSPIASLAPQATVKGENSAFAKSIVDRYEAQVSKTHTPKVMTFEYTVEQAGDRSVTQAHRIYRSGNLERDETFGNIIGKSKPKIRIFRNRPNAYSFENVAPRRAMYAFSLLGKVRVANHDGYLFHTTAIGHLSAFTVTEVVIDGQTYLPAAVDFTTLSATATGHGSLRYGEVEHNWVISEAEATAVVGKKRLREHFVFTNYRFPKSLPASTFGN